MGSKKETKPKKEKAVKKEASSKKEMATKILRNTTSMKVELIIDGEVKVFLPHKDEEVPKKFTYPRNLGLIER